LRIKAVDEETVSRIYLRFIEKVDYREVFVKGSASGKLSTKELVLLKIPFHPFPDVRLGKYLLYRERAAPFHHLHHKAVIADTVVFIASQAGPRIYDKGEKHPALRLEDFIFFQLAAIATIHVFHHFSELRRESVLSAKVVPDNPRTAWLELAGPVVCIVESEPVFFAGMMVEPKSYTGDIGYVGKDIGFADLYEPILNIFGMDELPFIHHPHMLK
jgi:hypothetical protein